MLSSIWSNSTHHHDPLTQFIKPTELHYPSYHFHRQEVIPPIPDTILSIIIPIVAYWSVSIFFTTLDYLQLPSVEKYRLHEPDELTRRNKVTAHEVIKAVIFQQVVQTFLGFLVLDEPDSILNRDFLTEMRSYALPISTIVRILLPPQHARWVLVKYGKAITQWTYWWGVPILQYFWASFIMDTWQYFWHRAFHINQWLYKHIHSVHHRLYCPYSFGALYNHPLEGFILDTLGALVAHLGSGMSVRQASVLFGLSTAKTVDDHCGLALPWDPLQHLFGNNADYHDIHHQQFGIKKNFSQPYFIHWDLILGTRMTRAEAQARFGKKTRSSDGDERKIMDVHTDARDPATITTVSSSPSSSSSFNLKEE